MPEVTEDLSMKRLCFRWIGVFFLLIIFCLPASTLAQGQKTRLDAATIKAGLRTETPEENGYIEQVLEMVRRGQLPRKLVEATFFWARRKPDHQFQYFQRALRLQATRLGFDAP